MTLTQLEYVISVVQEGSILAAAEKQHVSHPSISKSLTELERELGMKLFRRTSTGTVPTAGGLVVAESARRIQDELNQLRTALGSSEKNSIRLNIFPMDTTPHLMESVAQVRKQFPNLSIWLHQDTLTNVIESVVNQECDLGIVLLPKRNVQDLSSKLRVHSLRNEWLAVACSANHPIAKRDFATAEDLRDCSLVLHDDKVVMDILSDLFRTHGLKPVLTYANNNTIIKQMVRQGDAISIYTTALRSDPLVQSGAIRLVPLKDDSLMDDQFQTQFLCLSYARRQLASCERKLIQLLQQTDNG